MTIIKGVRVRLGDEQPMLCPDCGEETGMQERSRTENSVEKYRVICQDCEAAGPWETTRRAAISSWKRGERDEA